MFAVALLLAAVSPAHAQSDAALREQVLQAIDGGRQFLLREQFPDGHWEGGLSNYPVGVHCLAMLALANSGIDPKDPDFARGMQWLRDQNDPTSTYEISVALMLLATVRDSRDVGRIHRLAANLVSMQNPEGNWYYHGAGGSWDNSNTQFAVLGLREAAHAGVEISQDVWKRIQLHWMTTQRGMGGLDAAGGAGWSYQGASDVCGSMTVAGISSMVIAMSFLDTATRDGQLNCCGQDGPDDAEKSLQAGLRWMGQRFSVTRNPNRSDWWMYYLYGMERAGRLSGVRFMGDHDWYREGASILVSKQSIRNQSWAGEGSIEGNPVIATSYALLFLSKGLAPVLVNKLKFGPRHPETGEVVDDDWNRHPRDIANLTEHIAALDRWPKLLNWQVVDLRRAAAGEGVAALLQSPIQYMSGRQSPALLEEREVDLLRETINQGGFLFAVQNCDDPAFDRGFRELIGRLFPGGDYELRKLPPTHDVYRSEYVFGASPPELWGVDFGCRTAVIYAPFDHGCRWNNWLRHDPPSRAVDLKTQIAQSMALGVNVVAYATGRELHDKLDRPDALAAAPDDAQVRSRVPIARLRHTGGWDTAANAVRHLRLALRNAGISPSDESPNLAATDPALFDYPLVYMHGRKNFAMTDAEKEKLREYIENGGTLFSDACCGAALYDESFRRMVRDMFGRDLERIPIDHELYHMPTAYDIRRVSRRLPAAGGRQNALAVEESVGEPILEGVLVDGRYGIIYSKYDISCALERQSTLACAGYKSDDAARIAVNVVWYTLLQ